MLPMFWIVREVYELGFEEELGFGICTDSRGKDDADGDAIGDQEVRGEIKD